MEALAEVQWGRVALTGILGAHAVALFVLYYLIPVLR